MSFDESRIDTAAAEAYEEHLVSRLFGPWAELAVDLAAPRPEEQVLDAACGTGIGARLAAPRVAPGGRVVGLDNDPGMIEVASRLAAAAGLAAEWSCRSALELPFDNGTFDLCLCLQGPQFLPDPAEGFLELRRVLKPSGRLVASVWCSIEHNKGHYALAQALERQGVAPAMRPFSLGDAERIEAMARQAGFHGIDLRAEDKLARFPSVEAFIDGVAAGAPATRHALAKLPKERRRVFVEDVVDILKPYVTEDELILPTRSHVIVATP